MNGIIVDYLTFSVKPDPSSLDTNMELGLDVLLSFMSLKGEFDNFFSTGPRNGYLNCYQYNCISLYVSEGKEANGKEGFSVSMSGKGCRYFENLTKGFSWVGFFEKLLTLPEFGYKLSVSRLDLAVDDKDGLLNLSDILTASSNFEFVSSSRRHKPLREYDGKNLISQGYTYGTRGGRTFVRIYDKALEQKTQGHWVRFEVETKYEPAMRLINAMVVTGSKFGDFFAGYINSILRFVDFDDSNITRCSLKGWWSKFVGTVKRYSLRIQPYKGNSLDKMVNHLYHYMSANITTVISAVGLASFVEHVIESGAQRLKKKHMDVLNSPESCCKHYSNAQQWRHELPLSLELFMGECHALTA